MRMSLPYVVHPDASLCSVLLFLFLWLSSRIGVPSLELLITFVMEMFMLGPHCWADAFRSRNILCSSSKLSDISTILLAKQRLFKRFPFLMMLLLFHSKALNMFFRGLVKSFGDIVSSILCLSQC